MMLWRTLILCGSCWSMSACETARPARSAFFCQGKSGPGHATAAAAVRELPGGDLLFGVSKWQENGHHFGLFGTARRSGDHWVYLESSHGRGETATPPCKVTIFWPKRDKLAILVDEKIGCEYHHGRAFAWLSSLFASADYNGAVRDEFDDDDYADFGMRCAEPGARYGPVRVID